MDFSLDALEYYRLKELLGRYVSTDAGRFALDDLAPMLDEQKLESEHVITAEAMSYLREHRVPFNDVPLLGQALEKLAIAGRSFPKSKVCASDGKKSVRNFQNLHKPASGFRIFAISLNILDARFKTVKWTTNTVRSWRESGGLARRRARV